ncbi:unnamed protein product [Ectocarpus sp. 12 AP-2014]
MGTPATQLAMLEGLSRADTTTSSTSTTNSKKRRRSSDSPTAITAPSRRSAVASAHPSHLPDLPTFQTTPKGQEEGEEQGRGEIWRCTGGPPCDDVYCSSECQEAALAAGHGLICIGGSGEGRRVVGSFHRYAFRTSETYLIAGAAVASVLSTSLFSTEGVGEDSDDGIRPFKALEGWAEPYMSPSRGDDDDDEEVVDEGGGRRTIKGTTGNGGGGGGGGGGGAGGTIGFAAVKDIGVSMEEAEEAWSLLTAGLVHGPGVLGSLHRAATATPTARDGESGGRKSVERALSLDFFLRVVRALGRHLAPISVSSPLVSYCARLMQASPERKARALPWLAPAVERAGPFAGADGADEAGIDKPCQPSSTAEGRGPATVELRKRGGEVNGIEQKDGEDDAVIVGERGLCRLVQASAVAAAGTAASPFPPLSVVGLLPTHCSPQHSCVPNVQLEASLLPATKSANEIDGVHEAEKQVSSSTALRVGLVALRGIQAGEELFAPYITLGQPMQARQRELSSRFFAGRSASGGFAAASATGAGVSVSAAAVAAEVADTAPTGSCSLPGLSSLQRHSPQLVCNCPRCLLEAGGDHRLCGREMLKVLADQALEEGRHEAALGLYRASLAVPPPSPSLSSKNSSCTPALVAADTRARSGANNSGTTRREGGHLTACDPSSSIAAAAATAAAAPGNGEGEGVNDTSGERTAAVAEEESGGSERAAAQSAEQPEQEAEAAVLKGDALHGMGVALLAAWKFREACRAWERGFRDAPNHPALRAQAEKEAAYRPQAENGADAGECGGAEGPSPEKQGNRIISASPARGLHGDSSDDDAHQCFASIPGRAADIFLSRERVLSPEECRSVIQAAEDYSQANGGWTTSRHYAVPTTDLPLHVLKSKLPWFRSLVRERLFPALAKRFNLAAGPQRVFVHDAFVVRYEEGKQRHLPLHRDQSTHSFTIALNGLDQYTGGGTFFPSLGRSLRPAEGHALSFRGGILHGGDPLLKGVRYIVACFCYYDDGGDSDEEVARDGGELGSADSRLEAKGRESCKNIEGKTLGGSSSAVDSSSVGSGSTSPAEISGGENSRTGGGATRESKALSIEFRSDQAFSFGFGFG